MPAQAGIQTHLNSLGSRLRGNDENGIFQIFLRPYRWIVTARSADLLRAVHHRACDRVVVFRIDPPLDISGFSRAQGAIALGPRLNAADIGQVVSDSAS